MLPSNIFPWESKRAKYKEFIKEGQVVKQLIHMSPSNHNQNSERLRALHPDWNQTECSTFISAFCLTERRVLIHFVSKIDIIHTQCICGLFHKLSQVYISKGEVKIEDAYQVCASRVSLLMINEPIIFFFHQLNVCFFRSLMALFKFMMRSPNGRLHEGKCPNLEKQKSVGELFSVLSGGH